MQRLIVEGNDAIALSDILIQRKAKPPKGYSNKQKYKDDFVVKANSDTKIRTALKTILENTHIKKIGVIVDADTKDISSRLDSIRNIIVNELKLDFPTHFDISSSGYFHTFKDGRSIGIWIMPDNQSNGYLENFMCQLIPDTNDIWKFTKEKVEELSQQSFSEITTFNRQKVLMHTYLAWRAKPGLSMGSAVKAKYFEVQHLLIDNFIQWYETTFELEEPEPSKQ